MKTNTEENYLNNGNTFQLDNITWKDLDLDEVLKRLDKCSSSVGSEYLKKSLGSLSLSEEPLKKRSDKSDYLSENKTLSGKLCRVFKNLGKVKKISFLDYIFKLEEVESGGNFKHYLLIFLLILSIVCIFFYPVYGIIWLVLMFIINIAFYFRDKGKVEKHFLCVKYLAGMVIAAEKITALNLSGTPFEEDAAALKACSKTFAGIKRGSWLITNSVSGSLVDVVMDYVRMLFHVDLIKFNSMKKTAMENPDEIIRLYNTLGELELCLCVSDLREENEGNVCRPCFFKSSAQANQKELSFKNIRHPLLKAPVGNDLCVAKSVLLTGSNASGKSTFLRSVAINQILAQTLYTCFADEFNTSFFKVLSSMALSDNLMSGESYFVVEVKSLKRIFDSLGEAPVLCFTDEVLRGTNTKERIAASFAVLKALSSKDAVVFAATHDIELSVMLKDYMDNYHFSEVLVEGDVKFDYRLKKGPADTQNAIRLLKVFGFDSGVASEAESIAGKL